MFSDFKAFIARGNVLELAIAVILGAAFGAIIKTFTEGIVMPFVGLATGGIDFKSKFYDLSGSLPVNATPEQIGTAIKGGTPLLMYGQFINDVVTFLIVAVILFLVARYAVKIFKILEAVKLPTDETVLLAEIRDILRARDISADRP